MFLGIAVRAALWAALVTGLPQQLMAKHQKSRIMCTDADGRLIGIISLSDIARHESGDRASETLRQVSAREAKPLQSQPDM